MEQQKTIVFMEFPTIGEASIIKGTLESNHIPCFLSNVNNPYVGGFMTDGFLSIRLHIFEHDKEKAEELLALIRSANDEEDNLDWDISDPDEIND